MVTLKALSKYVMSAMLTWVPVKEHSYYEPEEKTLARYANIADDYAAVSLDPTEPAFFKGDEDGARVRTALLLASFGSLESSFKAAVDDGRERGDHGTAYCLMQVRPIRGIYFDGAKYGWAIFQTKEWRAENASRILVGDDLIKDRKVCFKAALHMLRTDGIDGYTGEGKNGKKAEFRVRRAKNWFTTHPYTEESEEKTSDEREKI